MTIAPRFHLFPFRTEKLSPVTPMVLRNSGRVGSRRFFSRAPAVVTDCGGFFMSSFLPFLSSPECFQDSFCSLHPGLLQEARSLRLLSCTLRFPSPVLCLMAYALLPPFMALLAAFQCAAISVLKRTVIRCPSG